jgi:hypothetical protein
VSVSGDVAVVGAIYGTDFGSAYVFRRNPGGPGSWVQEQKLLASDGAVGDHFGASVSVSGDVAVVGAWANDDQGDGSGSAYVFDMAGNAIPAVSTWGIIVLLLLLTATATVLIARGRVARR